MSSGGRVSIMLLSSGQQQLLGRLPQPRAAVGAAAPNARRRCRGAARFGAAAQPPAIARAAAPAAAASPSATAAAAAVAADRPTSPPTCELSGVLHTPHPSKFVDNNTSFVEEFRIRGNECGPDQRANIITIANLLQEVGGNHGVALWGRADSGFASMPGMDHLIFVATRIQIRMESYPKWGDLVRLETYFAEDGRLTTRRDWHITDARTGGYLGAATSTWVTINAETRKLAKLPEEVRARWLHLAPTPPRLVLPAPDTRRKLQEFPAAPALEGPVVSARRSDVDPNGHINNVCYLSWALEAVPEAVYGSHHLREVEMDFKAECHAGDTVQVLGHPLPQPPPASGGRQQQQFLHLLRKPQAEGGTEVWRARTTWVPKA
ncbi:oleoyl-acyl carrier thioesterase chloroplastic-like [Raphidocelis subcapitata]|uniref:Acyl-[acyl-carrier-protein] hydrolase n=1 Tax=Raphidocelis subcapitata TaxID=307507 RepID=A0A2V0PAF4_9CHLO|nr:oleoyl-acyl carrier thioesterase chloroplastic-like [Raphidocelis subcapitata]|eukprot:GBF96834.1 oleoyl-acyl carrier thioesterase chloroplastic-like [Raphidocelis subcapitata]